jgi:hypothetical protein
MKPVVLLIILLNLSIFVQAQFNTEKDPYLTQSLKGRSISKVNARTSGGSIAVTGIQSGEPRVEVYVRPSGNTNSRLSKEELRRKVEQDYDLKISVTNQVLNVTAKPKSNFNWKRQLSISYKIFVPQNVSTALNTSGGSINLSGLTGSQDFTTSGGSLHIDQLKGEVNGKTSGGSIQAQNSSGTISLNTSGGSLNLSNLQGSINATTSGGSINGSDIKGELITSTSGGSVNLTGLSCSLETSTSGGSMNVSIKEIGKYVSVSSAGGNIKLEIPGNKGLSLKVDGDRLKVGPLKNFNGQNDQRSVYGTINGGGIPVKVQGNNGVTVVFL